MINIYKTKEYQGSDPLNYFDKVDQVSKDEIVIREKQIGGEIYQYAEPAKQGHWAFGGNILYSSNRIDWPFSHPIKLHDRNMDLEG